MLGQDLETKGSLFGFTREQIFSNEKEEQAPTDFQIDLFINLIPKIEDWSFFLDEFTKEEDRALLNLFEKGLAEVAGAGTSNLVRLVYKITERVLCLAFNTNEVVAKLHLEIMIQMFKTASRHLVKD